jgi:cysteine desulfurase
VIYLDYNATTPVAPEVVEAVRQVLAEDFGNPSSVHRIGRSARRALETARGQVAGLIGAQPDEITFTSGGTESINSAIKGVAESKGGGHIVSTAVEHPAAMESLAWLARRGCTFTLVGVDSFGIIDPADVRRAIKADTILISVMHAQNEVGTIEPVEEIGRVAREAKVLFHVDAAQSAGKIAVDVERINADLLTIAGHKLYAPKGIGALYVREGMKIAPFVHGAMQEKGRRAGTENVALAVGLGVAATISHRHVGDPRVQELRDYFWRGLSDRFGARVALNGHPTDRLPNTLNVGFLGYRGGTILEQCDGLCASTGAACHADEVTPSAVLAAMGVGLERAEGAIRFSLGRPTTREQTDRVLKLLADVVLHQR